MKTRLLPLAILCGASSLLTGCFDSNDNDVKAQAKTPNQEVIAGTAIELRLLETTDLHANVLNFNYFSDSQDDKVGLVKTAALIHKARNAVQNSVLVDNGDLIQGSPLGDYMAKIKNLQDGEVHPVYKAMNTLDYDVANIGNHEFNFGLEFLQEAIDDANFPYISANVFKYDGDEDESNDEPLFSPYLIQDKAFVDNDGNTHTIKVGYIGFVPPQIMQWDKANLEGKVIAKDIIAMANKYVPEMKEKGADIIIAIPHSGLDTSAHTDKKENASYHLSKVEGIDAIMFGHAHANFPSSRYEGMEDKGIDLEKGTINGVAAVMPGFWGNHLGVIDVTLTYQAGAWQVTDSQSSLMPIFEQDADRNITALVDNDADVEAAVHHEHEETRTWVNKPFAKVTNQVNSFFALVNDDPSIQIVTDAQAWYTQKIVQGTELEGLPILSAGAPFRAGRGGADDYTYIATGDIAYRNVADLYIYPNILKVLKLNGTQVKEWLEMSAGQFNQINPDSADMQSLINPDFPSYNFDVIDGVTYQIDLTQPARYNSKGEKVSDGQRIVALSYQDKPVADGQEFLVVTNNYRASGGGNFPAIGADKIVVDSPDENRQVVANYITHQSEANDGKGLDPSADMNWSFTAIENVQIQFTTSNSDNAKAYSEQFGHIQPLEKTNEDGFALYLLNLSQNQ
ncbi:bifunctional 2',3'-cyclic-nucleotide 2'-phosphodiesterase/3'-nucleotidase [Pseudoalteromonas luteoviolacea]|uniref:2', 3'-cyclic nucleotide 2'-phosphodiesterase n=1 Tax=Pseudoalteromonas luteoviolacea H33 TaxID=1365251 RepID=A0A167FE74_9GAMM|nr:bifunctional 2',3'-cyclic-nucleotide 2'-phosphodiesterase/3'-nucleotidase [Pseudoalteromonas luteoviolacea]KZN52120.1 2', 3'-cyclic nucleotide 2'-phosphodiesterase [Pseudoalteromonas luteoviolacea H33]KZN78836.1 2', 3'-cyclic nucleotide 2'-phosphodiesterase [Pseudoalteromonas luteoviolacea H33-S]MBQ4876199.1 bifunctional 2',3'-cyclic-nucleotide 2'-phosphodiesterase/3'-nucleotidase [Pseudoalteromonas luteoviolacea]MBQ4906233.1 bifunctional 2',3'-cyclic-nucleotide 2'-phosphodiesterase/3'-nucle